MALIGLDDIQQLIAAPRADSVPDPSVPPACPICKGAGYYTLDVQVGDPNFGVLMTCRCKQAVKDQRAAAELFRLSNLGMLAAKTFATFDALRPGVERAVARAREYARRPQGWLTLLGGYGCGKTHLAAAVANTALARGERVYFAVVPDLLDQLRATFAADSDAAYDDRFGLMRDAALLVLDDLGTESVTAWAKEKLYQLVNYRYNAQLPTVVTTNRALDQIDGRIVSRLADGAFCDEIIAIKAADYRTRKLKIVS